MRKKAADSYGFLAHLAHDSTRAVKKHTLNEEEQAALFGGDVQERETRVGKLDERSKILLKCRLQQEKW